MSEEQAYIIIIFLVVALVFIFTALTDYFTWRKNYDKKLYNLLTDIYERLKHNNEEEHYEP